MAANPNTISAGIKETWDKVYQVTHHKIPVYPAFANFRLANQLKVGDTVNRQHRTALVTNTMGGDGGYTRQAIVDSNETLVINVEEEASFYIKKLDEIQNHLPTRAKHAYDAAAAIFNKIDGDVLGKYDAFTYACDDGTLGGTTGNGISVTVSNVSQLFTRSKKLLQRQNIMLDNGAKFTGFRKEDLMKPRGVAIISPDVYQTLLEYLEGKETALGDKVGINGHAGRYMGFDLFVSNATGWSAKLEFGTTDFTAGDTVVINGVTWTWVASVGTTAGNVLLGGTVADSIDALVAAINDSETLAASTAGTDYVELTDANRNLLKNIVATDVTTYMTLKATGKGYVVVSETATPNDILWTTTKQIQHCLFGVAGAVDAVIQKTPEMLIKDRTGYVGVDVVTWTAFGLKVFNESLVRMIDVKVRSDAY